MKKIINHLKENWIKYGFEALVVTVGILGAFTLNNWNENRQERKLELRLLEELKKEISINLSDLNLSTERQTLSRNTTKMILNLFGNWNDTGRRENIQIDSLSLVSMIPWTFNPHLGVTKSIISNGGIKTIRNPDIAFFISSFEDKMNDVTEAEIRLIGICDKLIKPRAFEYIHIISVNYDISVAKTDRTLPSSRFQPDVKGFFDDAVLENMFAEIYFTQLNIVNEQIEMAKYLESILNIVNSELKR